MSEPSPKAAQFFHGWPFFRGRPFFHGWVVVGAAFVVLLVAFGVAYSFGAFFASFQAEFEASRRDVSLVFSLSGFLYFALGGVSGMAADRFGPRRVIVLGLLLIAAGLVLASRAEALWQVYAAYGLGVGVGVGFTYVPAIAAVQPWFARRRGLASGIAVAGIGVGTLAAPLLATLLIESAGWRVAYLAMAASVVLIGGAAALLIESSPARRGLAPDGDPVPPPAPGAQGSAAAPAAGPGLRRALRSSPFRWLYAASALNSLGVFIPFVHIAAFAQDQGLPERTGVAMLGFIGAGSIVGRFALGAVADRLGRRRSLIAMYAGMALTMLWWLGIGSAWALALFAFLFGAFYGGLVALMPALSADFFGGRQLSGIIGLLYTSVAFGALVGPPLAGLAYDLGQSYAVPILAGALVNAAGVGCLLRLGEPRPWPAMSAQRREL